MYTRTGNLPIGFRRLWMDWHKDLEGLLEWAQHSRLSVIDLGADADKTGQAVTDAGLRLGSIDLLEWKSLLSPDKAKRDEAVAKNTEYINTCAKYGSMNYGYMVESFAALAPTLEEANAHIVIEGWPGPGALCCTPEGYRAFFREVPSNAMGVNFDPSHLIRMGIDPLRFLEEFKERVFHVHGKDCEILNENLYEYGSEQPPTFGTPIPFGNMHWRYTIPGHGGTRWTKVFEILKDAGYQGAVSIELEDAKFNGTEDGEKMGILQGAVFLTSC
jgi:sugar phosphate isomerase/epimerase